MPIQGIAQPAVIQIRQGLRLTAYDGKYDFAYDWYQDEETIYLVDGIREPYSHQKLKQMYEYLNSQGELYFIEVDQDGGYIPIGDVTFWKEDMPIVIGEKSFRGHGIGKKVIGHLVERGRQLGYDWLYVDEIYRYNTASRKCFESAGFEPYEKTERGDRFRLDLRNKRQDKGKSAENTLLKN